MPEFLTLHSIEEAKKILWDHLFPVKITGETVDTVAALGRILNEDTISGEDSPAFNRSTVDGYAVRSSDTFGASDALPAYLSLVGEVEMGKVADLTLEKGQTALIHTGGMLPRGCDAVVMLEQAQTLDTREVEIHKGVSKNENVILQGEDVRSGEVVIPAGKMIRPEEVGALLALGVMRVKVNKKPVVSIFSSGDEIIPPEVRPTPGQVRDINSYSLASLISLHGGDPVIQPIISDDPLKLEEAIRGVYADSDLIIITAGSSASARDKTAEVISRFGQPGVLVHGVNLRPGKPTILAVCNGKPMIGLPGNPVSALVVARLFVIPLVETLSGLTGTKTNPQITATLSINLSSQAGRDEYYPVVLSRMDDGWKAEPVFFKSNLIFSLSRANGLMHIPADVTGFSAGDPVEVILI